MANESAPSYVQALGNLERSMEDGKELLRRDQVLHPLSPHTAHRVKRVSKRVREDGKELLRRDQVGETPSWPLVPPYSLHTAYTY